MSERPPRDTHTTVVKSGGAAGWVVAVIVIVAVAIGLYLLYTNGVFGNNSGSNNEPASQGEEAPEVEAGITVEG